MPFILEAACGCVIGRVRKNNEDNFYFDGRCLEAENIGLKHPVAMTKALRRELAIAVFDGMGGENYGEYASFAAARCMQELLKTLNQYCVSERQFLIDLATKANSAVVEKASELCTEHMGTTLVSLFFTRQHVYVCNLGDSRAYRFRSGEFLQLSVDHTENRPDSTGKKAPLTQYLGIDPETIMISPHIAKGDIQGGDQYLLCSDGLTDMLTNLEIAEILSSTQSVEECVKRLIDKAMDKGGKDNTTVIVCRIL